jgi:hypothetical protein
MIFIARDPYIAYHGNTCGLMEPALMGTTVETLRQLSSTTAPCGTGGYRPGYAMRARKVRIVRYSETSGTTKAASRHSRT